MAENSTSTQPAQQAQAAAQQPADQTATILPSQTLYISNLNEKIKIPGRFAFCLEIELNFLFCFCGVCLL
jgi:hypothetical protein